MYDSGSFHSTQKLITFGFKMLSIYQMEFFIRHVNHNDYFKGHLELYQQLTTINPSGITYPQYCSFIDSLNNQHAIFVIDIDNKIIGTLTLLIETKLVHNMGKVAHIEDVVASDKFRGMGVGRLLVQHAIGYAKGSGCYKTILDCSSHNVGFYEKCGLKQNGSMMAIYH